MVVLGLRRLGGLVHEAVVDRVDGVAIGPGEGDEVDPADDLLVFAGPMPGDQAPLLRVRLVEHRVVEHEDRIRTTCQQRADFLPEDVWVGLESGEESGERVVGRGFVRDRLDPRRLGRARDLRRAEQELKVTIGCGPGRIHAPVLP